MLLYFNTESYMFVTLHHIMLYYVVLHYITLRYDTTEEFNVYSKAECDQLNPAHVNKKIYKRRN